LTKTSSEKICRRSMPHGIVTDHATIFVLPTTRSLLRRAALAGAATGLRSTVGLCALVNAGASGLPSLLTSRPARAAARLAFGSELVLDKLPSTPSRLAPRGISARITFSALTAAALARGESRTLFPAIVVAAASALGSAKVGHDVRAAASERCPAILVAVAEDALALSLAVASQRP
jgi:uncharacterized membrane protein